MKKFFFLIPLILFLLNVTIKLIHFPTKANFYSDAALRYRYARLFAEHKSIPNPDKKVLHPDGISPWRLIHPTQDALIGLSYRILKVGDFFAYTRIIIILFSSLSVLIFYFLARFLFKKRLAAELLTFLYAVGPPAYWRVIGNYLREEFALPFLFLGCLFLFQALKNTNRLKWLLAGFTFSAGLITWHMSQFVYGVIVAFIVGYTVFKPKVNVRWHDIVIFFAPIFILSFIWPPLFLKHFILSPQNFLICGLIIYLLLVEKFGKKSHFLLIFVVSIFMGVGISYVFGYGKEYSNVFYAMIYKIYFLLQKPGDPNLLPTDARLIWMGPFGSPGIITHIFAFGIYPFIFVISLIYGKQKKQNSFFYPVVFFTLIFFILYLTVMRLQVFSFFFLILGLGYLLNLNKRWILIILLVLGFVDVYKGYTFSYWQQRLLPWFQKEWGLRLSAYGNEWEEVIKWISMNIPEDEAILTDIDIGAMMLEKTNHPILIQPIYESKIARNRVILFIDAFYRSEDSLYSLAKGYKFKHILYHKRFFLDNSLNSNRYLTCHMEFDDRWVSYLFQFFSDSLHHFRKIVQTTSFALFSLDTTLNTVEKYSPFFDRNFYNIQFGETPHKDVIERAERNYLSLVKLYNETVRILKRKDYRRALEKIDIIHTNISEIERSLALEALCYQNLNETARACSLYTNYLLTHSGDLAVAVSAFKILKGKDRIKIAKAIYHAHFRNKKVHDFLKQLLTTQEFQQIIE